MAAIHVLFVASEAAPLVKTGGLGDVIGSLPPILKKLGLKITVVLPAYRQIDKQNFRKLELGPMSAWSSQDWPIDVWQGSLNGCDLYLLGNPVLFERQGLYSDQLGDFGDNLLRFSFFCRAVIRLSQALNLAPDIIHVHDWQTALLPAILQTKATAPSPLDKAATILTIHNLAYQGIFTQAQFHLTGLHDTFNHMDGIEYWGNISTLKAGIVCSDAITTVSPSYAQEIKNPQFGYGMDGILRDRASDLHGILNGVDYAIWNPGSNALLPANYDAAHLKDKRICRDHLLDLLELPPVKGRQTVLGMVGRLAYQKGLDILVPALEQILPDHDIRVVVLGAGETYYENMVMDLASRYPQKLRLIRRFSEQLAHLVQAGSDMLLMPSLYEPCGLSQLYALRYGTPPLVRNTGGLRDTVENYAPPGQGTGFVFSGYATEDLRDSILAALALFTKTSAWQALMRRAMRQDFSWEKSAGHYQALYQSLTRRS